MALTIKPMPHQIEGIQRIERCGYRTILADDMGLGKTIQTLGALHRNPSLFPAVVGCPAAVKYNWQHEATHFNLSASVCEGKNPPDGNGFENKPQLIICNYDILEDWIPTLRRWGVKTALYDECHTLTDPYNARTAAAMDLAEPLQNIICMSGTPMNKQPADMWPVLHMVWPNEFPTLHTYAQRYCRPRWTPWGWRYDGATNMGELYSRLMQLGLIRRTKEILNLPPKVRTVHHMALKEGEEYAYASANFLAWARQRFPERLHKIKKVQDLAKVGYLCRLAAEQKMRSVVEHIHRWMADNPGKKLVVMAIHKPVLRYLKKQLGIKSVTIDGSTSGRRRFELNYKFQHDPDTLLCLCNMKAAGVGINLTAAATMMFVEYWWNPSTHTQAEDRLHRIGQLFPVEVQYLVGAGTIEEKVCSLLQRRQSAASAGIDGLIRPTFNIYDEISKARRKGAFLSS